MSEPRFAVVTFAEAVLRVAIFARGLVSVVMFAPVKTFREPTFPEVTFAEAVFSVTAFALKRLESPETVSWVTFAPVKTFREPTFP